MPFYLAAVLLAALAGPALAQPKLIAIANFGEHPALRAAVNGFKAEVVRQGFVEGKDVVFDDQHVNFDRTLIPQLLTSAAAKKPAMIVAVTTPVAQTSIRVVTDKSIPIVFMSVVDPVVAKIVPSWERGSDTHTGATLYPDFNASLAFVRQLLPNAKRLGVPYNPGEDNDTTNMKEIRAGALAVQLHGFADMHMGFGVLINGLAAVIIGETLIGRTSLLRQVAAPLLGSIVYYQIVSLGLSLGLKPADLKLATGLFVLVTLALPAMRRGTEPEKFRE